MIVCRAVHHAHERGVIHRDLKPNNIMVSPDGQPHVLDFGLAKALLHAGKEAGISIDGEVAGTPGYMSPEQAAGKSDLDTRSDVYALGVILYRLLTGHAPHDLSGTYLDILRRVSEEEPKRPRLADRTMSRELEALLLRALQRDPAHRYKTAGELADDVERYLAGDPITAKPPTLIYFVRKRARKHRVAIIVATVGLCLVALTASLLIRLARTQYEKTRLGLENSQKAAIAKALAQAETDVKSGDVDLGKRNWSSANNSYLQALTFFAQAGASPMAANLGLWDLSRLAPAPLMTFTPDSTTSTTSMTSTTSTTSTKVTVTALTFLSDSRRALTGRSDGMLQLWDVATGQSLRIIPAHAATVQSVAVSADGLFAISGSKDNTLKLWNLSTGMNVAQFHDPGGLPKGWGITRVAISPDAKFVLSVNGASDETSLLSTHDDTLTLWDVASAKPLLRSNRAAGIFDMTASVTRIGFSPDSSKIVAAGGNVMVYRTADGTQQARLATSATAATFSPDGQWIAAGSSDGTVRLLDLANPQSAVTLTNPGSAILAVWFDPESGQVIAGTDDSAFRGMDLHGRELWNTPPRGDINAVAISPDGRVGLTATDDGLAAWRTAPPPAARELALDGPFPRVVMSRDGRLALSRGARRCAAVAGSGSSDVTLWDTATGKRITPSGLLLEHCNGVALNGDGRTLAYHTANTLVVDSLDPPRELWRFVIKPARSSNEPVPVALSMDGTRVAVGAADQSILVFQVVGNREPVRLVGHAGPITDICFSADGKLVLSGSEDQTARLWDADTGAAISVLRGHATAVNAVGLGDDGQTAVTVSGSTTHQAGEDDSLRVWQIPSGRQIHQAAMSARAASVAISGDGALIATGSDDGAIDLYDRATGDKLRSLRCPRGSAASLALDRQGHSLLCGGDALSLWKFSDVARSRTLEPAVIAARPEASVHPLDSQSVLALGQWYALRGEPAWAAELLEEARHVKSPISLLELARCDWTKHDLLNAEREMAGVSAVEAPDFYVKLCVEAIKSERR